MIAGEAGTLRRHMNRERLQGRGEESSFPRNNS